MRVATALKSKIDKDAHPFYPYCVTDRQTVQAVPNFVKASKKAAQMLLIFPILTGVCSC